MFFYNKINYDVHAKLCMPVCESVSKYTPWCVYRSEASLQCQHNLPPYLKMDFISVHDSCPWSIQEISCLFFPSPCNSAVITEVGPQSCFTLESNLPSQDARLNAWILFGSFELSDPQLLSMFCTMLGRFV